MRVCPVISRWLWRILALAMLGACTAVAVAWALAASLPARNLTKRYNVVGEPGLPALGTSRGMLISIDEFSRPGMVRRAWKPGVLKGVSSLAADWGKEATLALHLKTVNHDRSWGLLPDDLVHPTMKSIGAEDARGWPFLCLWCTLDEPVINSAVGGPPVRGGLPISRLTLKSRLSSFRALPLMPIWRGLVADAATYAGSWAVLIPAYLAIRSAIRRRRGRCPACGYDLGGKLGGGCPECGWNRPSAAP